MINEDRSRCPCSVADYHALLLALHVYPADAAWSAKCFKPTVSPISPFVPDILRRVIPNILGISPNKAQSETEPTQEVLTNPRDEVLVKHLEGLGRYGEVYFTIGQTIIDELRNILTPKGKFLTIADLLHPIKKTRDGSKVSCYGAFYLSSQLGSPSNLGLAICSIRNEVLCAGRPFDEAIKLADEPILEIAGRVGQLGDSFGEQLLPELRRVTSSYFGGK